MFAASQLQVTALYSNQELGGRYSSLVIASLTREGQTGDFVTVAGILDPLSCENSTSPRTHVQSRRFTRLCYEP